MAWIDTPNKVLVNQDAIAEILPPRALGTEYVVEMVMLNGDPSRQNKRELCRGTKAECEAFLDDLRPELDIIPKPKKKPAAPKSPPKSPPKSSGKSTKTTKPPSEPTEDAE